MFLFDEGALIGNTVYWRLYRIALLNLVKKVNRIFVMFYVPISYRKLVISFDSFLISFFAVFVNNIFENKHDPKAFHEWKVLPQSLS